ncbi:MAG TPA: mechanosensitive ion channel [Candidatus Krumholzibacteria bacterium]|nr:mechanosensitive ion channel [Candidatus Krumholzibacteria bacterium]
MPDVNINVQQLTDLVTVWGLKVLGAIAILLVGRIVAGSIRKGLRRVMGLRNVDPSLVGFVSSMAYWSIMAFVFIAALAKFGIQTASFVAILGAAGFAVGMALQGTLANFSSGVMIMLFRPFRTGDVIDAAGVKGAVKEISIFSTTIATPDNVRIIVPNGKLYGDIIRNFNGYDTRRVDMTVGIGYGSSMDQAIAIINGLLEADPRVLKDPAPVVAVAELADSSVNIIVRPWVNAADYWGVNLDFQKNVKEAFDAAGVEIPFPQRVVHMSKAEA